MSKSLLVAVCLLIVPLSAYGQDSLEVIGSYDGLTHMAKWDMTQINRIMVNTGMFQATPVLPMSWPLLTPVRKLVFSTAAPNPGCASVGTKPRDSRAAGVQVVSVLGRGSTTTFHLSPGAPGLLSIDIHTSNGKLVQRLSAATRVGIPSSVVWDRKNTLGEKCTPGVYHMSATLDGRLLSATTFASH